VLLEPRCKQWLFALPLRMAKMRYDDTLTINHSSIGRENQIGPASDRFKRFNLSTEAGKQIMKLLPLPNSQRMIDLLLAAHPGIDLVLNPKKLW
jgi:hypothetical protein